MTEIVERVGARVRGDAGPCFDFLGGGGARAAAFVDGDSCDRLAPRVVDAIPFAGRACREDDVGAGTVLQREADDGTLLVFEDAAAGVENRDDRNREARAREVVVE